MDPNEALKRLLELAKKVAEQDIEVYSDPEQRQDVADATELAQEVLDLHGWMSRGGFLPAEWAKLRSPDPSQLTQARRNGASWALAEVRRQMGLAINRLPADLRGSTSPGLTNYAVDKTMRELKKQL